VKVIGGDKCIATDRCGMSELRSTTECSASQGFSLAANDDNRRSWDRIVAATQGKYPVRSTPPGFFQDEVILFWPLLIQLLNLRHNSVRLRPETEQELANQALASAVGREILRVRGGVSIVRRILDLLH